MDSSRLPGKALTSVAGRPLIDHVIHRATRIAGLSALALATTDRPVDDELARYASSQGIEVCRGDASDVARRLYECGNRLGATYVVRLNGDTPFLDPELIQRGLERVPDGHDLITNIPGRTFPYGASVEIVKTSALERAHESMTAENREHVTQYFYEHPEAYDICTISSDNPRLASARMVVDTPEDLRQFERAARILGDSSLTADYRTIAAVCLDIGWIR